MRITTFEVFWKKNLPRIMQVSEKFRQLPRARLNFLIYNTALS